jgi:hypothetical protein
MCLTLSEREQKAYNAGDLALAAALKEQSEVVELLKTIVTHVNGDVIEGKDTRDLFDAVEQAEDYLGRTVL